MHTPEWVLGRVAALCGLGCIASVVALTMHCKLTPKSARNQTEQHVVGIVTASEQDAGFCHLLRPAPARPPAQRESSGSSIADTSGSRSSALSSAWSAWLSQYRWDWFGTLTLRNPREGERLSTHPESFVKAWRRCLLDLMSERVQVVEAWRSRREREWRVRRVLPVWILALEGTRGALGANVRLHGHFLAWFPEFDLMPRYDALKAWWQRERGWADVSHPRSVSDVSDYVSKYLTKSVRGADTEFEWFVSDNFGVAAVRAIEQPHLA